ncbi:hypothetical protein GM182_06780 [bacterium 3DAC]|nr:hypothetical protein GM182_06780 [bacterium 3DAC]
MMVDWGYVFMHPFVFKVETVMFLVLLAWLWKNFWLDKVHNYIALSVTFFALELFFNWFLPYIGIWVFFPPMSMYSIILAILLASVFMWGAMDVWQKLPRGLKVLLGVLALLSVLVFQHFLMLSMWLSLAGLYFIKQYVDLGHFKG